MAPELGGGGADCRVRARAPSSPSAFGSFGDVRRGLYELCLAQLVTATDHPASGPGCSPDHSPDRSPGTTIDAGAGSIFPGISSSEAAVSAAATAAAKAPPSSSSPSRSAGVELRAEAELSPARPMTPPPPPPPLPTPPEAENIAASYREGCAGAESLLGGGAATAGTAVSALGKLWSGTERELSRGAAGGPRGRRRARAGGGEWVVREFRRVGEGVKAVGIVCRASIVFWPWLLLLLLLVVVVVSLLTLLLCCCRRCCFLCVSSPLGQRRRGSLFSHTRSRALLSPGAPLAAADPRLKPGDAVGAVPGQAGPGSWGQPAPHGTNAVRGTLLAARARLPSFGERSSEKRMFRVSGVLFILAPSR